MNQQDVEQQQQQIPSTTQSDTGKSHFKTRTTFAVGLLLAIVVSILVLWDTKTIISQSRINIVQSTAMAVRRNLFHRPNVLLVKTLWENTIGNAITSSAPEAHLRVTY